MVVVLGCAWDLLFCDVIPTGGWSVLSRLRLRTERSVDGAAGSGPIGVRARGVAASTWFLGAVLVRLAVELMDWERRAGEPIRWYTRFEQYRLLGSTRCVERAFRQCRETEGLRATRPGAAWYEVARAWQWSARAETWDAVERERLREVEEDRRFDARETRLRFITDQLQASYDALVVAKLSSLSTGEAREMLPTLRNLFRDLLNAQRVELGLPAVDGTGVGNDSITFTADALLVAQRELERWRVERAAAVTVSGDDDSGGAF